MNKKINFIIVMAIFVIMAPVIAFAAQGGASTDGNEEDLSGNTSSVSDTSKGGWSQSDFGGQFPKGVRITLLTTDGKKYTDTTSIDIFDETEYNYLIRNSFSDFSGRSPSCSKVEYVKGMCSISLTPSDINQYYLASYYDNTFSEAIGLSGFSDKVDSAPGQGGETESIAAITNAFLDEPLEDLWVILKALFPNLTESDYKNWQDNPETLKNLWIALEPLTIIYGSDGKPIVGTQYEIAEYVESTSGSTRLSNLVHVGTKYMGLWAYVDGEIYKRNGDEVPAANGSSYFNGAISYESSSSAFHSTMKSSSQVYAYQVNDMGNHTGYGINLVWIYDAVKNHLEEEVFDQQSCEFMEQYYLDPEKGDVVDLQSLVVKSCPVMYLNEDGEYTNANGYVYPNQEDFPILNEFDFEFDFTEFNEKYGTDWTGAKYEELCGNQCEPEGVTKPDYNCYLEKDEGSCSPLDSLEYRDMYSGYNEREQLEFWNYCVFDDIGTWYNKTTNEPLDDSEHKTSSMFLDTSLGTSGDGGVYDFCPVYCVEEFVTSVSSNSDVVATVKAGQNFTVPNISVGGERTCKAEDINTERFIDALHEANVAVVNAYAKWQAEKEMLALYPEGTVTYTLSAQDEVGNEEGMWESVPNGTYYCSYDNLNIDGCEGEWLPNMMLVCKTPTTSPNYGNDCYVYNRWYPNVTATGVTVRINDSGDPENPNSYAGSGTSGSIAIQTASGIYEHNKPYTPSQATVNAAENAYNAAKVHVQNLIAAYEKCDSSNWNADNVYKPNASVIADYEDPNGVYSYNGTLVKNEEQLGTLNVDNECTDEPYEVILNCAGTSCDVSTQLISTCLFSNASRSGHANFRITDGIYQYVNKSDSDVKSFYGSNEEASKLPSEFSTNYVDLGYSNFPVAFNSKSGIYGTDTGNGGKLDFIFSNVGHQGNSTSLDSFIFSDDFNDTYECNYAVVPGILPDDSCNPDNDPNCPGTGSGGIRLIYRPIDLDNPFPDIDSEGRSTGYNWCDGANCSSLADNGFVDNYILTNRTVVSEELYNLDPMYTFILTPQIINEIRRYNDENTYGAYVGNSNDINSSSCEDGTCGYTCEVGTGDACISDYLSYLIEITDAANLPGTCVDDQYRKSTDAANFYNCRFTHDINNATPEIGGTGRLE